MWTADSWHYFKLVLMENSKHIQSRENGRMAPMGSFTSLPPDYSEANPRHFVDFKSRTCRAVSLTSGSGDVVWLGWVPGAHPRSSNGPWLWWPSLGTQSLARFPGLETRVTPAPGGGQACEAPPSGRRVGCPRHWPSPRRPPGRTGLPAQCPHGALPAAPGLPSPGGVVAVASAPLSPHTVASHLAWPLGGLTRGPQVLFPLA